VTPRRLADATRFLSERCTTCGDLLFEVAHVVKDGALFCNDDCARRLHKMKRRVFWETHGVSCVCVECCG